MMEGVQKHGGGGCEGVRWATVSMLQQAPSEASQTQRGFNPCHPYFPEK